MQTMWLCFPLCFFNCSSYLDAVALSFRLHAKRELDQLMMMKRAGLIVHFLCQPFPCFYSLVTNTPAGAHGLKHTCSFTSHQWMTSNSPEQVMSGTSEPSVCLPLWLFNDDIVHPSQTILWRGELEISFTLCSFSPSMHKLGNTGKCSIYDL